MINVPHFSFPVAPFRPAISSWQLLLGHAHLVCRSSVSVRGNHIMEDMEDHLLAEGLGEVSGVRVKDPARPRPGPRPPRLRPPRPRHHVQIT